MTPATRQPLRVALLADYAEENWPSMDLVAEMLAASLPQTGVSVTLIRPPMPQPLAALMGSRGRNIDRLAGRFIHYPRYVQRLARDFDVFHIVDHSYSQLVHALPPERCLVTCHDLDTFRSIFPPGHPGAESGRPWWYRRMTARILSGLRSAAYVACVSEATDRELASTRWVSEDRHGVIRNGVSDEYFLDPGSESQAWLDQWLHGSFGEDWRRTPYLLYVGSSIERKRIDVLLRVVAGAMQQDKDLRLVKAGGPLTSEQQSLAVELGIQDRLRFTPFLERSQLAALYRRAALVLQTSSSEGFGLPVAEAQACGAVVLASDLPVLREVGGDAAFYCPVADVPAWIEQTLTLRSLAQTNPLQLMQLQERSRRNASRFRWAEVARILGSRYQYLVGIMRR